MNRRFAGAGLMRRTGARGGAGGGAAPLILDGLPAPLAFYATFRASTAYEGPILRVHDGTNNHDVDDTSEIAAACGANAGRLSTAYDQGGAGRNITEGTNRPLIYNGTTLILNGSRACWQFDGTNDEMGRADAFGLSGAPALTVLEIVKRTGTRRAWSFGKSSPAGAGDLCYSQDTDASATRISFAGFGPFRRFTCADRTSTVHAYVYQIAAGANLNTATIWQSGNVLSQFDTTAGTFSLADQKFRLGCGLSGGGVEGHTAQEGIAWGVWDSVLSGADLTTLRARALAIALEAA